jgi:hypothetical protein
MVIQIYREVTLIAGILTYDFISFCFFFGLLQQTGLRQL